MNTSSDTINEDDLNFSFSKESGISHTRNILNAAIPYIHPKNQKIIKTIVKATEFLDLVTSSSTEDEMEACNLNSSGIDIEGMFGSIRQFCTSKEREFIDMIMNFIQAKKLFSVYRLFSSNSDSKDNPFSDFSESSSNLNMMDMLSSMLSSEQKSTFDNLSTILNTMNMDNED